MRRMAVLYLSLIVVAAAVVAALPRAVPWALARIRAPLVDSLAIERRRLKDEITVWKARYAEAATRVTVRTQTVYVQADTVLKLAPVVLQNLSNPQLVTDYVRLSTAAARTCTALANDCSTLRWTADSVIAKNDSLTRNLEQSRRRWWDRFGANVCWVPGRQREVAGAACYRVWP